MSILDKHEGCSTSALVVGADAESILAAAQALRDKGCSVHTEASVYRAVAHFTALPADLTIIDLDSLEAQQLEFINIFRDINPDTIILAIFSPENRRMAAEAVKRGADASMAQPFYPQELENLASRWADRAQRRTAALEYKQANLDSLARLARGIAHEINNPLTTLSGWLQMMIDEADDKKLKNRLNSMLEEADRVASVVGGLLDFGQENPEELRPVDLNALLVDLSEEIKRSFPKISIHEEYQAANPLVMGDARALKQACSMILHDGAAAIDGEGVLSLSTERTADGKIKLIISDNGRFIPPENLENIFEPFHFSSRAGGDKPSLVYPAVYGIIRSHRGEISVRSDQSGGTAFTALFPGV